MFVCVCAAIEAVCSIETLTSAYQIIRTIMRKRRVKWVPVSTARSVLRLRMDWPPIWRVVTNILNKQSRTADLGWSSSLGVGEVLTTHRKNV